MLKVGTQYLLITKILDTANKRFCTSGADLLTISIGGCFSCSQVEVTLLSGSNNNELFIINFATVPTYVTLLLSRLRKAVTLAAALTVHLFTNVLHAIFQLYLFKSFQVPN